MSFGKVVTQVMFSLGLGLCGFVGVSALLNSDLLGPDENVITIGGETEIMVAAQEQAAQTLPRFLELANSQPEGWGPISLKVGMRGRDMVEHIWIEEIEEQSNGGFAGKLANDPVGLTGLELGSRVFFDKEQVTDWAVVIDGRGYGYYTVRAISDFVSDEEAAQYAAFLSEQPLPPGF
ncbi:MAG: DUF2314 domain-containing protein [Pseudomonadota bacterium]